MATKSTRKTSRTKRHKKIKVGDRVVVSFAGHRLRAKVIEDRGFIGVGGRQLVRIITRLNPKEPSTELDYEVPVEEILFR